MSETSRLAKNFIVVDYGAVEDGNAAKSDNVFLLPFKGVSNKFIGKKDAGDDGEKKKSTPWYKNLDYIATFIGLFSFAAIVCTSIYEIKTARITEWCGGVDLLTSVTFRNGILFGTMIFSTIVIAALVHLIVGKKQGVAYYLITMFFVFASQLIGSQCNLRQNGFGAAIWCILFGVLARLCCNKERFEYINERLIGLDFFIKVGIVLLAVDLNTIGVSGTKGLVVAWAETVLLLFVVYFVAKCVLKDASQALLVAAGLSICGSSAIIALCSIVGINEKSDFVVALLAVMTILTVPLIPSMPKVGALFLNGSTIGAWIGGSIDSTGAVVASSSLGNNADSISTALIVKMAQNVLIGPVAMVVTHAWSKECKPSILWEKFPKFVLGFILVAVVTFFLPTDLRARVTDDSFAVSEWWSNVSFVLLGFEINLRNANEQFGKFGKMAGVYIFGQLLDIASTLLVSWLMFTVVQ